MRHDFRPSRLEGEKFMKAKRKVLGPTVVLDQERCILCTRCVRFMAEVAKEPQLGVFGRGSAELIDTFPGKQLDSNYSGNTVDICPVGALLNRDFRFRGPELVPLRRAQRLHRLLPRLQHLRRLHGAGHLPLPPPGERGDQQELDVRPGPALVQVRSTSSGWRRRCWAAARTGARPPCPRR